MNSSKQVTLYSEPQRKTKILSNRQSPIRTILCYIEQDTILKITFRQTESGCWAISQNINPFHFENRSNCRAVKKRRNDQKTRTYLIISRMIIVVATNIANYCTASNIKIVTTVIKVCWHRRMTKTTTKTKLTKTHRLLYSLLFFGINYSTESKHNNYATCANNKCALIQKCSVLRFLKLTVEWMNEWNFRTKSKDAG